MNNSTIDKRLITSLVMLLLFASSVLGIKVSKGSAQVEETASCSNSYNSVKCRAKLISNVDELVWEGQDGLTISTELGGNYILDEVYIITVDPPAMGRDLYSLRKATWLPKSYVVCTNELLRDAKYIEKGMYSWLAEEDEINRVILPERLIIPKGGVKKSRAYTYFIVEGNEVRFIYPEEGEKYGFTDCPQAIEINSSHH